MRNPSTTLELIKVIELADATLGKEGSEYRLFLGGLSRSDALSRALNDP